MVKRQDYIIGAVILGSFILLLVLMIFFFSGIQDGSDISIGTGDKIAIIELKNIIYDSRTIVRQFEKYGSDKSIKAIVFRVDSPGGGVAASQEIYEKVKSIRNSGKPVIVTMGSVAASGGYYVSCGADTIIANPGTITGSIGVIAEFVHMQELLDKIGVGVTTIKSGALKDVGAPYREMTGDERASLQKVIDNAYDQFVTMISEEREIDKAKIIKFADGRIFTGQQAYENKLIDLLGTFQDAIDVAAKIANIKGKPTLVRERKRKLTIFDLLTGDLDNLIARFGLGQTLKISYLMKW